MHSVQSAWATIAKPDPNRPRSTKNPSTRTSRGSGAGATSVALKFYPVFEVKIDESTDKNRDWNGFHISDGSGCGLPFPWLQTIGHWIEYPPSTGRGCPVTYDASSEQSQTTAEAISSG